MNDQDEMFERATETPAFLGCPQHMPKTLPSGFDGTEPGEENHGLHGLHGLPDGSNTCESVKSVVDEEELKKRGAKIKACNDHSYAKMVRIAELANECVLKTTHSEYAPGQYGQDYRTFGRAMCEIRKLVRESVADVDPDYEMLALQFARNSFDFAKFQEALAAVASMKSEDFPGVYYTPGWLVELAKKLSSGFDGVGKGEDNHGLHGLHGLPDGSNPCESVKSVVDEGALKKQGKLFKRKHISSCHGTYIYDYTCINDAHIRANLHYDNGGLENHATIWLNEGERCFCYATFNTCSAAKCNYIVRGMISGLAKRLVYHHKNLIKRKAKWAAAKAAKKEVA